MTVHYFDALAGAGKTRALARHADRLARRGQKVLFIQPTKHLIDKTVQDELRPLDPLYRLTVVHGGTAETVVADLVRHFQAADDGGEVLFATHAAFFLLPYVQNEDRWHLIVDEVPQVDAFEELNLPDTHHLITPFLDMEPVGARYGRLVQRGSRR